MTKMFWKILDRFCVWVWIKTRADRMIELNKAADREVLRQRTMDVKP